MFDISYCVCACSEPQKTCSSKHDEDINEGELTHLKDFVSIFKRNVGFVYFICQPFPFIIFLQMGWWGVGSGEGQVTAQSRLLRSCRASQFKLFTLFRRPPQQIASIKCIYLCQQSVTDNCLSCISKLMRTAVGSIS